MVEFVNKFVFINKVVTETMQRQYNLDHSPRAQPIVSEHRSSSVLPVIRNTIGANRPSPLRGINRRNASFLRDPSSELGTAQKGRKGVPFSTRSRFMSHQSSDGGQTGTALQKRKVGQSQKSQLAVQLKRRESVRKVSFDQGKLSSDTGTASKTPGKKVGATFFQRSDGTGTLQSSNNLALKERLPPAVMLPVLSSAVERTQQMYNRNYLIDIDTRLMSQRQTGGRINTFYDNIIKKNILQTTQPSPLLSPEKVAIINDVRKAHFSQRGGSVVHTATKHHDNDDFNDRLLNIESQINNENGGELFLPQLKNVMSQDNLMDQQHMMMLYNQKNAQSMAELGYNNNERPEMSQDNRATAVDTQPQTQSYVGPTALGTHTANSDQMPNAQLSMAESMLHQSQQMDPTAGNSVVNYLNTSLRNDAQQLVTKKIEKSMVERERQRKRRDLAGDQEIKVMAGKFIHKSTLEEVEANESGSLHSKDEVESDSLANSSVYNVLMDDLEAVQAYVNADKKAELTRKLSKSNVSKLTLNQSFKERTMDIAKDEKELKKMREDPEAYFKRMKAQIKLKAVKQFQEDLVTKKEEEENTNKIVTVLKDQFGRVMKKVAPKMNTKVLPSVNRKPRKKQRPKRKISFTEMQMKFYAEDAYNPMKNMPSPTLTDQHVIDAMKEADRFPIPEALIGRERNKAFTLQIDSLISHSYKMESVLAWADVEQELDAPFCSMESEEEFPLYDSAESDEIDVFPYIPKAKLDQNPELKKKQFDISLLSTMPFRIESMKYYPGQSRDQDFPIKLLKVLKIDTLWKATEQIIEQQKKGRWSNQLIQNIFDYFCLEMKAAPIELSSFFVFDDPNCHKISFKNFQLDEQTIKALILILPYLVDFVEIELYNNQMTDNVAPGLLFAIYCNPSICRLTIAYNYMRQSFSRCLKRLMDLKPEKLNEINLMGSIMYTDHIEPIVRTLPFLTKTIKLLNIAGCTLTHAMCREMSRFMLNSYAIGVMDVSHCRINYQGSRYLIDALNRNQTIRNFNFSHNDLTSATFEFSIKVASIITRHPSLQHLDITNTNLKREEIMFIGLSLPVSKTLLSVHLTAQKLPYYERVFLRAAIAARVGFAYRTSTQKKAIGSNKEKNQILTMARGEVQEAAMADYTLKLRDLDEKREVMDVEIQDLLAEMDTQASFKEFDPEDQETHAQPDTKVGQLIEKLVERQKEIEAQQRALKNAYSENSSEIREKLDALEGVKDLGKEMHEMFGDPKAQQAMIKPEEEENAFEKMRELRVERQRIKAEIEVQKDGKDRSAGELALMFMGINQVARDLLVENPMTGYMNEIIFSRILGHDEIEEGTFWVDAVQCWVCQKWDKINITFNEAEDKGVFVQKVNQLDQLNKKIDECVDEAMRADRNARAEDTEIESVNLDDDSSYIQEVSPELEGTTRMTGSHMQTMMQKTNESGARQSQNESRLPGTSRNTANNTRMTDKTPIQRVDTVQNPAITDLNSPRSALKDRTVDTVRSIAKDKKSEPTVIEEADREDEEPLGVIDEANIGLDRTSNQESEVTALINPVNQEIDTSNPLAPVTVNVDLVNKLVFPENFSQVNKFQYIKPRAEEIWGAEQRKIRMLQNMAKKYVSGANQMNPKNTMNMIPLHRNTTDLINNPAMAKISSGLMTPRNSGFQSPRTQNDPRDFINSKGGGSSFANDDVYSTVISHTEIRRRKKGEPVIIQRQIFFDGVVYMIEEELFSDSECSSVYTSEEDGFEIDKQLPGKFKDQSKLKDTELDMNEEYNSQKSVVGLPKLTIARLGTQYSAEKGKNKEFEKTGMDDDIMKKTGEGFNKKKAVEVEDLDKNSVLNLSEQKNKKNDNNLKVESIKGKDDDTRSKRSTFDKSQRSVHLEAKAGLNKEFFINSTGLTQAQKDYESKVAPKHYRPELMERRLKFHEGKIKKLKGKKGSEQEEVYIMASFNDWIPMRMKTMRSLLFERYPLEYPQEEIPKQVLLADSTVNQYAMMVHPGAHYFYFAKEKGAIFLSPKYEVVRFKQTQIFLNRIKVNKRLEMIETVFQAKDGEEDEAVFMKDRSVFRDYREDTQPYLLKCFEEDWQFGKIPRTVNRKDDVEAELEAIKTILFAEYVQITNIFDYYSGISQYPTISMNDFTSFANQCEILDHNYINLAALDLLLVATCVSINQFVNSAEKDLQRYEFLEMIVRVANFRYKESGLVKTTVEGIKRTLQELIYPNANYMDGANFRRYYCYNVKSNEILKKNEAHIRRVYDSFTHAKKRYITVTECQAYILKLGLTVSSIMVGAIYAESMMMIIDTIRDQTKPNQMKYVEFIVFLCRIAHEHYKNSPYASELLYLKLDHLMPAFLSHSNLQPLFVFGERFSIDEERDRKRQKRRKQRLKEQHAEAKKGGRPVDVNLLNQVKAFQEKNKKDGSKSLRGSQLSMLTISSESDLGENSEDEKQKPETNKVKVPLANTAEKADDHTIGSEASPNAKTTLAVPSLDLGAGKNIDIGNDLVAQTAVEIDQSPSMGIIKGELQVVTPKNLQTKDQDSNKLDPKNIAEDA